MDLSDVLHVLERGWRIATRATSADNESLVSRGLRVLVTVLSYGFFYTKSAGTLLNGMVYLVDHHWYVLSVTCAVVVLAISAALLAAYEWMWRWQAWLLASTSGSSQHRVVTVEDDDTESWQAWAKKLGRVALIILAWSLYCWVNVRLDYWVFWSQYSVAHPKFNLELILVNCLQAGPILVGSAYTLYHLYPAFFTWHHAPLSAANLPSSSNSIGETHMQSLLS